jgi:hypothetical protein
MLVCQLVHSSRFKEGSAIWVGTMTEQLWALFKACAIVKFAACFRNAWDVST